jgi:DNA repair protein RecO (recombination protein O)
MQWSDEGIILATRRHGESSLILELMTRGHGRHLGLVRGGRSRRQQPTLQAGNTVSVTWRARLDEHLGNYTAEPVEERASALMAGPTGIYGVQMMGTLLRLLPERDPHPGLYDALGAILDALDAPLPGGEMLVRFELAVLNELGFGLDLASCAATGLAGDLAYVSPKTGRAVSRAAGAPYHGRLLALPAFLTLRTGAPTAGDLLAAFALTGYFLDRHVHEPRGIESASARERFLSLLRISGPVESAA